MLCVASAVRTEPVAPVSFPLAAHRKPAEPDSDSDTDTEASGNNKEVLGTETDSKINSIDPDSDPRKAVYCPVANIDLP